jgi:hypothetical protein
MVTRDDFRCPLCDAVFGETHDVGCPGVGVIDVEAEPRGAVITSRGITRAAAASGAFDPDAEVQS